MSNTAKDDIYFCNYEPSNMMVRQFFSAKYPKNIVKPVVAVSLQDINKFNKHQCTHVVLDKNDKFDGFIKIKPEDAEEDISTKNLMLRKRAYVKESDPLYMESMYDETVEKYAEWKAKVAEIKLRYPIR